ncbi:hypothetical protein MCHI_002313 [Candidatus Magnetoovum chiemensis]|nr:hypothetical protein MCHI_002313 [Candidatus Magnetoovum chiemensis]
MLEPKKTFVICDCPLSKQAHQELFGFPDDVYIFADTDVYSLLQPLCLNINTVIHIAATWTTTLKLILNENNITAKNAIDVIKPFLKENDERSLMQIAEIDDIFNRLYYAKRFDILRKTCSAAVKTIIENLKNPLCQIQCHLAAHSTKVIVASSL